MFIPVKRATLLYPSGSTHHLFILLTDPFGPPGQILMVPACTIREGSHYDDTCILAVGDHPFIQHHSYVAYNHCRIEPALKLVNGVETGEFIDKGLIHEGPFARILAGLGRSKFTKPFALHFLKEVVAANKKK